MDEEFEILGEKPGNIEDYVALKRLIEGVFNNIGLDILMDIIEVTLKSPVMIVDMGFQVLAESRSVRDDPDYHFIYKDRVFLDEACIELIRAHYVFSKMRERDYSSAVIKRRGQDPFLVASIKISGADVLMLVVFEDGRKLEQAELILTKKICQVMAVEFQKENSFNRHRLNVPNHHIVTSLLRGKDIPREEFFDKMSYMEWVNARELYIMIIAEEGGHDLEVRAASVVNALKLFVPMENCLMYESDIVVFLTPRLYEELCLKGFTKFEEFLGDNNLRSAVSCVFHDVMDIRYHYLLAQNTLKAAKKFKLAFALFSKVRHYIIADLLGERFRINDFLHPAVVELLRYDRENNSDLLTTLKCYMYHKEDLELVTGTLFIHKSTLFYRIKKIKELTGLNLERTKEVSSLYFSLKLLEVYGKSEILSSLSGNIGEIQPKQGEKP